MRATTKPGVFVSTMNAEMPFLPAALSVTREHDRDVGVGAAS